MLSFTRHTDATFEGSETVPADALRSRPTLSFQVKSDRPIPSTAKRRESHLTSLAVDYLCRWATVVPANQPFGDRETEETAFYAAIAEADLDQRAGMLLDDAAEATDTPDALAEQVAAHTMLNSPACCQSRSLHDWSCDLVSKKVFEVNQRPHIVVHYAHPCNKHGREIKALTSEEAERRGEKPREQRIFLSDDSDGCLSQRSPVVNALMCELMEKHSTLRQKKSSQEVAQTIEQTCVERERERERVAEKERCARRKEVAKAQRKYIDACNTVLAKATLAMQKGSATDAPTESATKLAASEYSDDDLSSSEGSESATFSDEEPLPVLPRTYADVARSALDQVRQEDTEQSESSCDSTLSSEEGEDSCEDSTENSSSESIADDENETGDRDVPVAESEPKQSDADGEDASKQPKPLGMRQTSFEAMIPVCESSDTLATFDKMQCNFVLQWAASAAANAPKTAPRKKIHLFRREDAVEAYFGIWSRKKTVYHLIASIEML